MSVLSVILLCVLLAAVSFVVVRWLLKVDTKIEGYRRDAAKLASVLAGLGLKKTPEFLVDFSVGDVSGMAEKIADLAKLFVGGEEAVVKEFSQVLDSLLSAKLSSESGRAWVAAKLSDAVKQSDPSVVQDAPVACVK